MPVVPFRRSSRLPILFLVASLLPAGALAWLGWRLIDQDRRLERQRTQDLVESAANGVAAFLERELSGIERNLGTSAAAEPSLPWEATASIRADRTGRASVLNGTPLPYDLAAPGAEHDPPPATWVAAERIEFVEKDLKAAISAYRVLARSSDRNVRAGALVREARALRRSGQVEQALATYAALAAMSGASVAGDPADLFARWARIELLTSQRQDGVARAEAVALDQELGGGRWPLSRTTALAYAELLRPWRSAIDEAALAERLTLADAVADVWTRWRDPSAVTPFGNGRGMVRSGTSDHLIVWRGDGDLLWLFAGSSPRLFAAWQEAWGQPDVHVSLVDRDGRTLFGNESTAGIVTVVKTAAETHLPWTLRVTAPSIPPAIAAPGKSRRMMIGLGLGLLALLIVGSGYLVVRTTQKELALARQQAEFVAAVSHEFRSPLTSMAHLTSLLRSDFQPTEERRRQYYDVLASETERLRRFIETLLDFGRMQAGAAQYRLEQADLAGIVRASTEEFRHHRAAGSRVVSLALPDSVPPISADAEAIGRALWNLLENAAKYSPEGAPIAVRVALHDARVAIHVTDQGDGIPASEQPFIFNQFFRGALAVRSAVKGTGVGLAVVRHIVSGHGGEVSVESSVGKGTTMTIEVPLVLREPRTEGGVERKVS